MRLYFVSDIHGSQTCWLKFLGSAKFYEADTIVVGGDITGKFVVPIVTEPNGKITAVFNGLKRRVDDDAQLAQLKKQIAGSGSYWFETSREEHAEYETDPARLDALFHRLVLERAEGWVALADERLAGSPVRCIVNCGNDDFFEIDDVLEASTAIDVPEGRVLELGSGLEMIGVGYANLTPWNCPRDLPEPELAAHIDAAATQLSDPERAIFNVHVPPYGSELDTAPRLTEDLQLVVTPSGEPELIAAGSTAVREAIERYRPLLGLHGHIHESKGLRHIGRTLVANPGSEYQEGMLHGVLVDFDQSGAVKHAELVTG
ncbi:MAG: metallophosphoesterase family protein [Solirubrobacterales bacterium]